MYAIWTNLSAFEESSAACVRDMLTHVSAGVYLDAIRMAEKFILHVEVLFAAIDEIEERFAGIGAKGTSTSCLPHASFDSWHLHLGLNRHVACSGSSDTVSYDGRLVYTSLAYAQSQRPKVVWVEDDTGVAYSCYRAFTLP